MIALIWNIIVGQFCDHTFEVIKKDDFIAMSNLNATRYHMRCVGCGKMKFVRSNW